MNKRYGSKAEKQAAYRARKKLEKGLSLGEVKVPLEGREEIGLKDVEPVVVVDMKKLRQVVGACEIAKTLIEEKERVFWAGKPAEATEEEWGYALVRAGRAKRYAEKMPEHVRPSEVIYQDPVWQWRNQVLTPQERATRGKVA